MAACALCQVEVIKAEIRVKKKFIQGVKQITVIFEEREVESEKIYKWLQQGAALSAKS